MEKTYYYETKYSSRPRFVKAFSDEHAIDLARANGAIILYEEISATEMRTVWDAAPLPPIDYGPGYRAAETANGE